MSLLPAALVIAIVKKAKGWAVVPNYSQSWRFLVTPPLCAVTSSWTDITQIERLCQKVYFPSEEFPWGSMALMHGVLCRVIEEFAQHKDPTLTDYNLHDCVDLCETNFQQCLESHESFFIPTLENIQALFLAV